jgi:hypothetical protein
MSPKSGKAGTAVNPVDPKVAKDAITAEAGAMTKVQASPEEKKAHKDLGKPAGAGASKEEADDEKEPLSWIEIEMVGEDDKPIAGVPYEIELPDGSLASGVLDDKGLARVEGFIKGSGQCKVSFPQLDKEAWDKA